MNKLLPFILMLLFSACSSGPAKPIKPDWIQNPERGAVGSSATHIKGRHYQEDLAITRARERLAARYGVEISSIQTIKERVENERVYLSSKKQIDQSIKNKEVKAHVRAVWHDWSQDELWVWVYPVN